MHRKKPAMPEVTRYLSKYLQPDVKSNRCLTNPLSGSGANSQRAILSCSPGPVDTI
jgi:hypothetical protein